jgi:hypothetical protein
MPVTSIEQRRKGRLSPRAPKRVAAVILEDGTVRPLDEASKDSQTESFATGRVSGPDWVLWWERRSWPTQP